MRITISASSKYILLIDFQNLFIRQFCANKALTTEGEPIGGVIGFLQATKNLVNQFSPNKVICVLEGEGGALRKRQVFAEYKKNRKTPSSPFLNETIDYSPEENKKFQTYNLVNLLKLTPINLVYVKNAECDDVLAWISKYKFAENKKIIVSNDKDFYQLLDEKTSIFSPATKSIINEKYVLDKFNISAKNFLIAKIINGDPSDNINGIKGIGFKTIAKKFDFLKGDKESSLSDIFQFCEQNHQKANVYKKIYENFSILERNWKLMKLDINQLTAGQIKKVEYRIDNFSPKLQKIKFLKILYEMKVDFNSFNLERFWMSILPLGF